MILRQDEPSCLSRIQSTSRALPLGVYRESGLVLGGIAVVPSCPMTVGTDRTFRNVEGDLDHPHRPSRDPGAVPFETHLVTGANSRRGLLLSSFLRFPTPVVAHNVQSLSAQRHLNLRLNSRYQLPLSAACRERCRRHRC